MTAHETPAAELRARLSAIAEVAVKGRGATGRLASGATGGGTDETEE